MKKLKYSELESMLLAKEAEITELTKKLEQSRSSTKYYEGQMCEANKEIEQLHVFLDSLPDGIPRDVKYGEEDYQVSKVSVFTRLVAWFAKNASIQRV
jgi:septal ring factor EnvC (AmiA/AmiB activator)